MLQQQQQQQQAQAQSQLQSPPPPQQQQHFQDVQQEYQSQLDQIHQQHVQQISVLMAQLNDMKQQIQQQQQQPPVPLVKENKDSENKELVVKENKDTVDIRVDSEVHRGIIRSEYGKASVQAATNKFAGDHTTFPLWSKTMETILSNVGLSDLLTQEISANDKSNKLKLDNALMILLGGLSSNIALKYTSTVQPKLGLSEE